MIGELIASLHEDDNRPAILGRATRGDLARLIRTYAASLHAHGFAPGDTLGLAVRPGPRSLAILLAAYHLGIRVAVLDPTAGPDVLRARISLAAPRLILADAAAQAVAGWAAPLARRANLELPDLTSLAPTATIGRRLPGNAPKFRLVDGQMLTKWGEDGFTAGADASDQGGDGDAAAGTAHVEGNATDTGAADAAESSAGIRQGRDVAPGKGEPGKGDRPEHRQPEQNTSMQRRAGQSDAVIVFTSGTTSRPRAVVHTRDSVEAGMRAVHALVRPEPGRPILGGTFFVLVPSLAAGATVALPKRRPRSLARQIARLAPQATYLTPPELRAALAAGARFTGSVYSGSAPVSADLLRRVKAAGAARAWGVYALTEVFPAAVVEAGDKLAYRGSGDLVGRLLPGVRAQVDDGGQVLLAGANAADRYLGEEPLEWVATGDIGRLEGDSLILGGRAKDMILRGAENIYPGLYEPSLHVEGVELAVIVGVPAGDGDERVVAIVQPADRAELSAVRGALDVPLRRMGSARPDRVLFATVPLAGRSRKPDRAAAARLAAES